MVSLAPTGERNMEKAEAHRRVAWTSMSDFHMPSIPYLLVYCYDRRVWTDKHIMGSTSFIDCGSLYEESTSIKMKPVRFIGRSWCCGIYNILCKQ